MFQHQFNKTLKRRKKRDWKSKTLYFKTIKETIQNKIY